MFQESIMTKDKRGTKRQCENCDARFYDLDRSPIICPLCEIAFAVEKPKPRVAPKPAAKPAPEVESKPEPEKKAEEVEATAAPKPNPDLISLEEAAEEEGNDDELKLADLGDDEVEIPPEENGDVLIEQDEAEPGSDMSDIIVTSVEPKDDR